MSRWQQVLDEIRAHQTEIMRERPYKDIGLVPNPGASIGAIAAVEQRLGSPLPDSYREFLVWYDGWPRFYEGASLLGTASLGVRQYDEWVQQVFNAAETPVLDQGPPTSRTRRRPLIPFGVDMQGTTIFAFDASTRLPDGELAVVAWVNEIGLRFDGFEDFLDSVQAWLRAEVEATSSSSRAPEAAAGPVQRSA
jgi:hypothetical protein